MKNNPEKNVSIYDVAEISNTPYMKAFSPENIVNGFKITWLFPLNTEMFQEHEYLPSLVSDHPAEENSPSCAPTQSLDTINELEMNSEPSNSSHLPCTPVSQQTSQNHVKNHCISPFKLALLPKAPPRKTMKQIKVERNGNRWY